MMKPQRWVAPDRSAHPLLAASRARDWIAARDPGHAALRRAGRTAILMPGSFALCLKVIGSPMMATFAAFGAIAMVLLVDFRGPIRDRALSQAMVVVTGCALICLGTLCARSAIAATAGMVVFGVVVLFSGVVSSVLAGASNALLLAFILPVSLPGTASQIPLRLAGWGIVGGLSVLAVALAWPASPRDPLQEAATASCRALAVRLRLRADDTSPQADLATMRAADALAALSRVFLATPYRPAGLTTAARAGVRLVDELAWLGSIVLGFEPVSGRAGDTPDQVAEPGASGAEAVRSAAAETLEHCAETLLDPHQPRDRLLEAQRALHAASRALSEVVHAPHPSSAVAARQMLSALGPAFRAHEVSFMVAEIAGNVEIMSAASRRGWVARVLGRQPPGIDGPLSSARERARSHLTRRSVWAHNSLRGGVALGLAVLVARVIGVEHAFWVSFGTLSVLRSNSLSTGQTFARALAGTVAGFVLGTAVVLAVGANVSLLWALLPFAVLVAGLAPAVISFAAGQAGFTVVLFIMLNILVPAGWRIGLIRIEDVAIGGVTSLLVGLLFWPRGAGGALDRALADAYREAAHYLVGTVECVGVAGAPDTHRPAPDVARAAAASRRLDDAFRTYLAERGPKKMGLPAVTTLVSGASTLRLAGDAILALWRDAPDRTPGTAEAGRVLLTRTRGLAAWYDRLAVTLVRSDTPAPQPDPPSIAIHDLLQSIVERDSRSADDAAPFAGVGVAWTAEHLDAVRRLEAVLARRVGDARSERARSKPGRPWDRTASRPPLRGQEGQAEV